MPKEDLEKQYSSTKKNYTKFLDILDKVNKERFSNPDQYTKFMQTIAENPESIQSLYDNYYNMRNEITEARKNNDNTIISGLRQELERTGSMQKPPTSVAQNPNQTANEVQQPMMTGNVSSLWQNMMWTAEIKQAQPVQNNNQVNTIPQTTPVAINPQNTASGWMLTTLNDTPWFTSRGYNVKL